MPCPYKKMKCKNCENKALYEEFSPDGPSYYFCSQECCDRYHKSIWKKGVGYRASPLTKIRGK